MRDRSDPYLGVADRQVVVAHVMKDDVASKVAVVDGKVGGPHELSEHLAQGPALLRGTVDVEPGPLPISRRKKRQTLHVVPMNVGDESRPLKGSVGRLGLAKPAQAGAEVENQRQLPLDLQGDARRVPPVTSIFG
jgi:hypothetical protein